MKYLTSKRISTDSCVHKFACVDYVYTAPDCQLAIIVTITHLIHSLWGQRTETVKNALTLLPPPASTLPPAPVKRRPVGWRGGGRSSPPTRAAGHRRFEFKGLAAVRCPTPPTPHHPPSPVSRRQESAQILLLGAALQLLSILSLITVQTHEGSSWCHQLICPHYHHTPVSRTKPHLNG